jgi:hypothetical protein
MSLVFWYGVITLLMQKLCDPKFDPPRDWRR